MIRRISGVAVTALAVVVLASPACSPSDGTGKGEPCGLLSEPCPEGFECTPLPYRIVDNGIEEYCYSSEEDSVYVPAGDFWMGSNADKWDDPDPRGLPRLHVTTPAYVIHQSPVSFEDYHRCVDEPDPDRACHPEKIYGDGAEREYIESMPEYPEIPIINVNWFDAAGYCSWLAGETGKAWRLCSEAEWEKAARGGCETLGAQMAEGKTCKEAMRLYPWGDAFPVCDLAWSDLNCDLSTRDHTSPPPIRSRPASASAYGMLQAWGTRPQWVEDCHAYHWEDEYQPRDGSPRLEGCIKSDHDATFQPHANDESERVARGGSTDSCELKWAGAPFFCDRLTDRNSSPPKQRNGWTIRCCRDVAP